jgi:NAD(P)-dependent dehydrogenase (short-subunit alcohol dehydrogenase family)
MRLGGEVALVHGATRGMGRRIAERFASEGAKVVCTGRNETRGLEVEKAILEAGGTARFIRGDISVEEDIRNAVDETVATFGRLTIVANVAGAVENQAGATKVDDTAESITTAGWDKIMATDLRGTWLSCKYAIPEMRRAGKGSIINFSSYAANMGRAGVAAYSAAKAGVHALTRSVAVENAADQIRCNCMVIGLVPNWQSSFFDEPEFQKALATAQPLGLGTEDDMAFAALYLASDESHYVTGTTLQIDGGLSIIVQRPMTPHHGGDESLG